MVSSPFDDHNKYLRNTVSYAIIKSAELLTVKVNVGYFMCMINHSINLLYPS